MNGIYLPQPDETEGERLAYLSMSEKGPIREFSDDSRL